QRRAQRLEQCAVVLDLGDALERRDRVLEDLGEAGERAAQPLRRPDGDDHDRRAAVAAEEPRAAAPAADAAVDAAQDDRAGGTRRAEQLDGLAVGGAAAPRALAGAAVERELRGVARAVGERRPGDV